MPHPRSSEALDRCRTAVRRALLSALVLTLLSTCTPQPPVDNGDGGGGASRTFSSDTTLAELSNRLIGRTAIAAILLVLARHISPLWLGLIGLTLLSLTGRSNLRAIAARRAARIWAASVGCAVAAAVAWVVLMEPFSTAHSIYPAGGFTTSEILVHNVNAIWRHYGAMIGLFGWSEVPTPSITVFLWTAVPGLLSVLFLVLFVREAPRQLAKPRVVAAASVKQGTDVDGAPVPALHHEGEQPLGAAFWRMLAVIFLFTLSLSTDAFLLLRASQLGVPQAMIPILWAALHVVKSSSSFVGGALSDRFGRRPLILTGWGVYAFVYLGFAVASAP